MQGLHKNDKDVQSVQTACVSWFHVCLEFLNVTQSRTETFKLLFNIILYIYQTMQTKEVLFLSH